MGADTSSGRGTKDYRDGPRRSVTAGEDELHEVTSAGPSL